MKIANIRLKALVAGVGLSALVHFGATATAQVQNPDKPVVFRVDVVSRTTKAINFHHRQGSTVMGLEGSSLAPKAKGEVRVDSKTGATKVDAAVDKMPAPSSLGEGYLTYVLWAITPEGRAENLGELMLDDDHARLQAATELQTFGLIVTAEPYFAVTQPSDVVVLEGVVKSDGAASTTGTIMPIETKYELVARGGYLQNLPPGDRVALREAKNIPVDLMEARQAMAVARVAGANTYAADTLRKAEVDLKNAEDMLRSGQDKRKIQSLARHVTQLAEDARLISIRKANELALAAEREAADRKAAELARNAEEARRKTEQVREQSATALAAKDRQLAEEAERLRQASDKVAEVTAREQRLAAEISRLKESTEADKQETAGRLRQLEDEAARARLDAQAAARQRDELTARRAELETEMARARQSAEMAVAKQREFERLAADAKMAAERAEADRVKMREELVRQLNVVLMTRETARGLIVNMSDVLFETGRFALKPGAREKLARIAGIVQSHPGLRLEVEGHTDSTGGAALNQRLSEQRANSVRDFLVQQGIDSASITARGFGPDRPVAENNTAAGRQANRRVELVVSGAMISRQTN